MLDRVGQQFGNYHFIHLLGRGQFAEIYLGEHVHLGTQAAIKVLSGQMESGDREAFLNEARTIARLRHPHIVRILDFGVADGIPFLVMDYAPDGSLRKLHPHGTLLPLVTVVSYVKQVASALQYAHDEQLVHRDIKPENMLLGHTKDVLLSDFGLAMIIRSSLYQKVQETAGTAVYMAPEALRGQPCAASDQYALGIVVYEWLSGERPFAGTLTEVAVKQALVPPPSLHEKVPSIPLTVEQVVFKALAKDPELRFAQVRDFALALETASTSDESGGTVVMPSLEQPAEPRQTSMYNLPVVLTTFIGREQDVTAVRALLERPEVRLLTLLGTGGIGKTRLSLEVATQMRAHFADGVCFVPLAPISDPNLVVPTIAQVLDIRESRAQSLLEQLQEALRHRHLLLLLDNVEQVVSMAPLLDGLLAACPQLKLLVTSRELLHIQAEHVFQVPPLSLPDRTQLAESTTLVQYGALALFVQRAQALQPSFQLTQANARAIAEICMRLDGLPLAIELAAARIRLLPPQALLPRLSQRLAVLTGGARTLPERQQTLRNTLKWSYDLLDSQEQRLFRRLAVFMGGWTLEAVETVADAGQQAEQDDFSVLDGMASLLDKSLLLQVAQEGEEPRLIMLETVHEYGLEVLNASGEAEATRQAHAVYYLALAEQAEPELRGTQQAVWLERLEREHENLRAAMRWLLEHGETEMALRLGAALLMFWVVHGNLDEGRNFLEQGLAGNERNIAPVQAKALFAAGLLSQLQDDYDWAEALCQKSLALFRELGDRRSIATSLHRLGVIACGRCDYASLHPLVEEALTLFRELAETGGIADSLLLLAWAAFFKGEYTSARALAEESLTLFKEVDDPVGIINAFQHLARVIFYQGDYETAHSLIEQCLALSMKSSYKQTTAESLGILGQVVLHQGDTARARLLLEESVASMKEVGDRSGIVSSLSSLASAVAAQNDRAAARALYEESLAVARQIGDKWSSAFCLEGLANMLAAQREPVWAARLWGGAEALREAIGAPLPPNDRAGYERSVTAARDQLGEAALAAAWAEGRTMTLEQALAAKGQTLMLTPASAPPSAPLAPTAKPPVTYPAGLSAREVEVLRLVAQGMTDAQVAEQLVISPRTVNSHLRSIYSKIDVTSRSAATRYAVDHHLV